MNKKELVRIVSKITHMTKQDVDLVLTSALETIIVAVSQEEVVRLVGFGSFSSRKRKLPMIHKEFIKRAISNGVVKFSPGKFFKQSICSLI